MGFKLDPIVELTAMFISQSEIAVAEGESDALERAFRERARRVDHHDGFLGLELLREVGNSGRYVLLTRWRTKAHFRAYLKSADFRFAHGRQHEGVVEATGGAPLRQFDLVALGRAG